MAVAATITEQIFLEPALILVYGTFTFSGNYVNNGEVPTYAGLKTAKSTPLTLLVQGGGYIFEYDLSTGKLLVRQGDNPNAAAAPATQLAAAAYPAGLTGATVRFIGLFKKA